MTGPELYEKVWELLEGSQFDRFGELFTDDCTFDFGGRPIMGLAGGREYFAGVMATFPDLRHEVVSVLEVPGALAAEVRASGTQDGPLRIGGDSVLPATGRTAVFVASDFLWYGDDQRITRWNAYTDSLAMLAQLGLVADVARALETP